MPKVIVVGGGIAGLASGIAFGKAGWDVEVLERARRIEPVGAALSLWPNACDAMSSLGILNSVSAAAAPIRKMLLATQGGQPIFQRELSDTALLITRSALQNALLDAFGPERLRLDCPVSSIAAGRVTLATGDVLFCDLVVDAGGIRALGAAGPPAHYAGYGGVLALSEQVIGEDLDGLAAEYWGRNERFGVFELPDNRRYWFHMRTQPADAAMPDLATCMAFAQRWPLSVRRAVAATSQNALIPFAVHAKPPPKSLCAPGGIIRVGDAAHAMEPNLGQGVCQGLEDASALHALAVLLQLDSIAPGYERLRLKRVRRFVAESERARFGTHGPVVGQFLMRAVMKAVPKAISKSQVQVMHSMPDYALSATREYR